MKRRLLSGILLTSAAALLLTGCSGEKGEEEVEVSKDAKIIEEVINETKRIREENDFKAFEKITYPNSPYSDFIEFYVGQEGEDYILEDGSIKTVVELSGFKMIKEKKEIAIALVSEHITTSGEMINSEIETEYYYVMEKDKEGWKIYDYIPTSVVSEDIELFVSKYEK